jgi:TPP-dependent pyruvate/acetoin dehydrogenase alpha subunit
MARPAAFGMTAVEIDGQDVRAVYSAAAALVGRAREGGGPAFMLLNTYRYHGHHVGDISRAYYRPKAEEQQWISDRDPIKILNDWLLKEGLTDAAALEKIGAELTAEMDAAVEFAVAAPYPSPDEVNQDIYA